MTFNGISRLIMLKAPAHKNMDKKPPHIPTNPSNQTLKSLKVAFKWLAEISRNFSADAEYVAYVGVGEYFNRFTREEWSTIPAQVEEILMHIQDSPATTAEIVMVKKEGNQTKISGMATENGKWRATHKDVLLQNLTIEHPEEINTEYVDIKEEFPDCPANSAENPEESDAPKAMKTNQVEPPARINKLKQAIETLADIGAENELYYDLLLDNNYGYFDPEISADIEDFYAMTPCDDAIVRITTRRNGKWLTAAAEFKNKAWTTLTGAETAKLNSKYPEMSWLENFHPEYVSVEAFPVPLPFSA